MTILQTIKVTINGTLVVADQVKGQGRQEIYYKLDGNLLTSDEFWKKVRA
jgi:hypothetical protein